MKKGDVRSYALLITFLLLALILGSLIYNKFSGYLIFQENEICGQNLTESSELNSTQSCFGSGPSLVSSGIGLNCNNYNLVGNNSGSGISTSDSDVLIENCVIQSFDSNLDINGDNTTIMHSSISTSSTSDAMIASGLTTNLINTTFDDSDITLNTNSKLYVKSYLKVKVEYDNGTEVASAMVQIYNESSDATQLTGTADSDGSLLVIVTDYLKEESGDTDFVYKINATDGTSTTSQSFNIDGNSQLTLTLTIPVIEITLNSPGDNLMTNQDTQTFSCSVPESFTNTTIYIWDSTGVYYNNETNEADVNLEDDGHYTWNCLSYNNSVLVSAEKNFSITIDTTSPTINLISPEDDGTDSGSIDFEFNVSDDNDIVNCSLIIDNEIRDTDNSISKNTKQDFSESLSEAETYEWSIICVDEADNIEESEKREIIVEGEETTETETSAPCTDACTPSGKTEENCANRTTLRSRTCGNFDSDSCLDWSGWTYKSCGEGKDCISGLCIGSAPTQTKDAGTAGRTVETVETSNMTEETPMNLTVNFSKFRPSTYIPHGSVNSILIDLTLIIFLIAIVISIRYLLVRLAKKEK